MNGDMNGDIVDTIDNALDDWAMSADAMRWAPDAPRVASPLAASRMARLNISINTTPFRDAMAKFAEKLATLVPVFAKIGTAMARMEERQGLAQHQPIPLRIDGHAYRRRTKGRR